ncbi:tetratricopeptide repeat protein [Sphingomonas jatrophae]|uniref:Tetratricopeptide repeat-containing protein n=1 Tax=Sphingomonas jatrophae TaxID=1166337 RepID=A0A1I6JJN2_9SPHN|nr:tetratricopeptide repeat protein [Sphingomonas jatrophae]SFR79094.1 Tetratricopeptide repeat-containing protein [Sphingomonas jatrophae]
MKTLSTSLLALALACGGAAIVAVPAAAAKKEEAKAPSYNLSKPVREAIVAAQAAIQANDAATAQAKIAEAKAAAKTDDDRFVAASTLLDLSRVTKDEKQEQEALDGLLAGNRLAPAQRTQVLVLSGQRALQANQTARAEQLLAEAIQLAPNNQDAVALLAETKVKAGKPAEGLAIFQQSIAAAKQSGTKLPKNWYDRAVNIAYSAKLPQQAEALTQEWLIAYPTKDTWRDSLVIWRDLNKIDADTQLDLMRLQRAAGAMKGAGDFGEYVDATYNKNPGEAKAVLDEGVRAGAINLTANKSLGEINTLVGQRMGADKASLGKSAADAKGAKGTARLAQNVADGYLGYGQWQEAADMYRVALTKPGIDANLINTRLGMALFRAGDKAGATEAWSKVTGPRAGLVKYWTILMNQGPATA